VIDFMAKYLGAEQHFAYSVRSVMEVERKEFSKANATKSSLEQLTSLPVSFVQYCLKHFFVGFLPACCRTGIHRNRKQNKQQIKNIRTICQRFVFLNKID